MAKKKPNQSNGISSGMELVVNIEIMELINKGVINNCLMTHKELPLHYRGPIRVFVPGREDKALDMEVTNVMTVGNGYLATGYPESWRTRGTSNGIRVIYVKPLSEAQAPVAERVPSEDEGEE